MTKMQNKKCYGLDEVNVSFLDKSTKTPPPLIISPQSDDTLDFICTWLEENHPWVELQILCYRAVLV
jgi:hypothetical protein